MGLNILLLDTDSKEYIDMGKQVGEHGFQMPDHGIVKFLCRHQGAMLKVTHDGENDADEATEVDCWTNYAQEARFPNNRGCEKKSRRV